ncbi:MAG: DUF3090 family protein [Candidatus Dormibacteraceae bacterium]
MADSIELEPVEALAVATSGEPGHRQFFLQARGAGRIVTLACEKFHIQGLLARIQQLLDAQGLDVAGPARSPAEAAGAVEPLDVAWEVTEMGLGFHESRGQFVIVAKEAPGEHEGATARFWASPEQIRIFARQAGEVLAGGRPVCSHCGLPIDPEGHPCPAANGSRPVF